MPVNAKEEQKSYVPEEFLILMTEDATGMPDGYTLTSYEKGEIYRVNEGLARIFMQQGKAECKENPKQLKKIEGQMTLMSRNATEEERDRKAHEDNLLRLGVPINLSEELNPTPKVDTPVPADGEFLPNVPPSGGKADEEDSEDDEDAQPGKPKRARPSR